MTPYEVMLSESQERMLLVAKKGREREVFDICDKWDLAHAIVGRVTDTGKLVVKSGGQTVVDLPIAPLTTMRPSTTGRASGPPGKTKRRGCRTFRKPRTWSRR